MLLKCWFIDVSYLINTDMMMQLILYEKNELSQETSVFFKEIIKINQSSHDNISVLMKTQLTSQTLDRRPLDLVTLHTCVLGWQV